ncbi:uncharacterized protein LOC119628383 isoform X1 [Bombyx mori]|uniref:uncharacterized protein LOC119628383 isoform X1 n=1 Tax=Bombyx mori TaxID=7091 RepID=UPI002ED688E7
MSQHSEDLDTLIKRRGAIKAKLTIFRNYIKPLSSFSSLTDLQRFELEGRYERIQCLYNDFDKLQTEIETLLDAPDDDFKSRCEFEDQYHPTVALARSLLSATTNSEGSAMVRVRGADGTKHPARVLLDNGSTANFVTDAFSSKLGLSRHGTSSTTITGINNQTSYSTQSCNLTLESYYGNYTVDLGCLILPEVTKVLPSRFIPRTHVPLPSGLHLADPTFNIPSVVDILVGAEIFWQVLLHNTIDLGKNQPTLHETKLGWIVSGLVAYSPRLQSQSHFCSLVKNDVNFNIERFWELDSVPSKHSLTNEENACEQHFLRNTYRNDDGRFVVSIPLKRDPQILGDSLQMAISQFLSLERRFQRDLGFKQRYVDFMHGYLKLGHMTKESEVRNFSESSTDKGVSYFMPHHGIIRESSTTTKLRTVFDASAITTSGVSLNDIQMIGPVVQDDLLSILLRFRQHRYVISGDIEKMYRSIEVNPSQRSLQRIVFRDNHNAPLKVYCLNTVTYGTASAPYLATKCLTSLASSAVSEDVKHAIIHDFYVDDLLSGNSTLSGTIELCKGVIDTLSSAQFHLRKFKSNDSRILSAIMSERGDASTDNMLDLNSDVNTSSKTLGLQWCCNVDMLSFSINIDICSKITKRHVLSVVSQIFDPLGLVSPCVVEAKILMQRLWIDKYNWDDVVSQELRDLWSSFTSTLSSLNQLKIPRFISCSDSTNNEIHVFCDASEKVYGACLYIRSIKASGSICVRLLASKSRLAPIKPTTIPRLELCGALAATRLCTKVRDSLTMPIDNVYFWCDSTIVLAWLSTSPNRLKPFVRNRVNEIQESTIGCTWSYVPSKDNPADLVSRGLKADAISTSSLWWSGPSSLFKSQEYWPQKPNMKQDLPDVVCHVVSSNVDTLHTNKTHGSSIIHHLITKYSNLRYLQRVVAYILRAIYNFKNKSNKNIANLSNEELQISLNLIIHNAQLQMFPEEYFILKLGKSLPRSSRLISLTPFIDSNSILRVGGRLDNSPYDFNIKHPIVLCSKHALTKLIFHFEHLHLLHAGPQLLLTHIRQSYWPLGGRNLSKTVVRNCLKCFRYRAQNVQPIMGQLPKTRTDLQFPFLNCSVDYAGPILIADRKGRGCKLVKSYLCIFVCLAVKAVHIELVTALSSEAYIAALKRFVSRRGKPRSIWSDNGTNFVGACNELKGVLSNSDIASFMSQEGIDFNFSPPYSPHFNGLAEAAVKATKGHLKKLLSLTHLTYEEMSSCLCQIEAILNSRPLTPISSDPLDLTALTPAHFLIGRPLTSVPHPQITDGNITRLERYQRVELIRQHFWKRFINEYISLLQQKSKWSTSTGSLIPGTLVLVKDRTLPALLWPLGRITKTYPGSDGITRVAEVKTRTGTVVRGFNSICPLPLH